MNFSGYFRFFWIFFWGFLDLKQCVRDFLFLVIYPSLLILVKRVLKLTNLNINLIFLFYKNNRNSNSHQIENVHPCKKNISNMKLTSNEQRRSPLRPNNNNNNNNNNIWEIYVLVLSRRLFRVCASLYLLQLSLEEESQEGNWWEMWSYIMLNLDTNIQVPFFRVSLFVVSTSWKIAPFVHMTCWGGMGEDDSAQECNQVPLVDIFLATCMWLNQLIISFGIIATILIIFAIKKDSTLEKLSSWSWRSKLDWRVNNWKQMNLSDLGGWL